MSSSLRSMDSIMIFITASLRKVENIFKSVENIHLNALICYKDKNGDRNHFLLNMITTRKTKLKTSNFQEIS